jgi:sugar/nucleoside kinase (ribokinase family)
MSNSSLPQRVVRSLENAAERLSKMKGVVGFDGFVDTILHVVKTRQSATEYTRMEKMGEFAQKIAEAAGFSANLEMVAQMQKLGGNGPIMANALGAFGMPATYLGNLGFPAIHPVFADFAKAATVHSVAEPGYTDAIEFDDGKLMFGKHQSLREVNWDNLLAHVPEAQLQGIFEQSRFVAVVNWTMLTQMKGILSGLAERIAPKLGGEKRVVFFDLADPAKRSVEDIAEVLCQISGFERHFEVVLGMNFSESQQVAAALGMPSIQETPETVERRAVEIREKLQIKVAVVHPTHFAAAACAEGSACVQGPFCAKPKITTGAGDHFNAGFCTGRILGLGLEESLQVGVGTSGFYVRNAKSPSVADLRGFLETL